MFKKSFAVLLTLALSFSLSSPASAKDSTFPIYMYKSQLHFNTPPIIKNNRTFVEMRPIFEKAGITLYWDQSTQTVTGSKGSDTFKLTLGSKSAYINGKTVQLDEAPFAKNNYTFIPLRYVAEATNHKVDWHSTFHLIHIHKYLNFIEDRAFTKDQLNSGMLAALREGRFPDFPVGLEDGVGVLLDVAGTPNIYKPGLPETEETVHWMYGDYWIDFGPYKNGFYQITVKPTQATFSIDEMINALGPAENIYIDDYSGKNIYAYYEGIYMYEFTFSDKGNIDSIHLKRWRTF